MNINKYPKVAVTGTKGKTSVVRMLDFALRPLFDEVLRVDTSGAYINGDLKVDEAESRERWGYTLTNNPGRFLSYITKLSNISLLEATVFSFVTGLGYKAHDIGIFTNVFEDHIDSEGLLRTAEDIADKKSFIFSAIQPGGTAIYNMDDPLVCSKLIHLRPQTKRIGVSLRTVDATDSIICYVDDKRIVIHDKKTEFASTELDVFPWINQGHQPSLYTLGFVYATLFALLDKGQFAVAIERLKQYVYDPAGGRMVHLLIEDGPTVILDFAHEKHSLIALARYARTLGVPGSQLIGVVRLAPSRTEKLISDTARAIKSEYDRFIVYDKVDGYYRHAGIVKGFVAKEEEVGKVSKLLSESLRKFGAVHTEQIIREDHAIEAAIKMAKKGDVVVYIVNDDSARSLNFLKAAAGKRKVNII